VVQTTTTLKSTLEGTARTFITPAELLTNDPQRPSLGLFITLKYDRPKIMAWWLRTTN
jgi:hypothetical protein